MFIVHYYFLHKERDFSVHCAFSKMHKFFLHLVFGCVTLVSEKKLSKFFWQTGKPAIRVPPTGERAKTAVGRLFEKGA